MNRIADIIRFLGLALTGIMLLLPASGRAERPLLLDNPVLSVTLENGTQGTEQAEVSLTCVNRGETEEIIRFLIPRIDGEDTVFANRWPGEEVSLLPGQETPVRLSILKTTPGEEPGRISFRIAFGGILSVPIEIDPENPEAVTTVTLAEEEPCAVKEEAGADTASVPEPIRIQDQITEEETAKLDYGRAWICLETEEGLFPFCEIRLQVNEKGEASAEYSGTAFVPEEDPGWPLAGQEEETDAGVTFRTDEMALTGRSVFYASLRLTLRRTDEGTYAVQKQEYTSEELGGTYGFAPLELADQAEVVARILENSPAPKETAGVRTAQLSLEQPFSLKACRASDLGVIRIYCEYFFHDGTDTVHPLYTP